MSKDPKAVREGATWTPGKSLQAEGSARFKVPEVGAAKAASVLEGESEELSSGERWAGVQQGHVGPWELF